MRWGKLIVFLILVVAILGFNLLLKDRLLEKGLEAALEGIFEAKAEVSGFRLKLLQARVRLGHLEIANAERPFKNLVELGRTVVHLNLNELLKRKLVIEEVACEEIRWNTDRESSGKLDSGRQGKRESSSLEHTGAKAAEVMESEATTFITRFDPKKLIEERRGQLQSPEEIKRANDSLSQARKRWEQSLAELEEDIRETSASVSELRGIQAGKIDDIKTARQSYERAAGLLRRVHRLHEDLDGIRSGIRGDLTSLEQQAVMIKEAIDRDQAYLRSQLRIPEGGARDLVSSLVRDYLKSRLGRLYSLMLRMQDYASSLAEEREKRKPPSRRPGIEVPFPTVSHPKFLLKRFAASLGERGGKEFFEAELRDLSSNPDLWNRPLSYRISLQRGDRELGVDGFLDLRSERDEALQLNLLADGYAFQIDQGLQLLKADELGGRFRFDTSLQIDHENQGQGRASIDLRDLEIDSRGEEDLVAGILRDTLLAAEKVQIAAEYRVSQPGNKTSLKLSTNLDEEVSRQVRARLDELINQYAELLREELHGELEPGLEEYAGLQGSLRELERVASDHDRQLENSRSQIEEKQKEIEARIKELSAGAAEKIREQAEKIKIPSF